MFRASLRPKHVEEQLINNWSSWSHIYLLIKDARSLEHKVKLRDNTECTVIV